MSHEVENMFSVVETPWHKLGVILGDAPNTRDAIVAAGLDWKVGLKDLQTTDGTPVAHKALYRETDGRIYDVVGPDWKPLQNAEAMSWFDPFLESGDAKLETAGSLRHGKHVWILARLNRDPSVIVGDDAVLKYLLLSNAHQGGVSVRVGFTPVRVVCANTLAMAHNNGASQLIRINHTSGTRVAMEKVRETMNLANAAFEATADQYRMLAQMPIVESTLQKYVQIVFSPKPRKDAKTGELKLVTPPQIFDKVKELFETGRGNDMPGVRGTMWAAYNGVTEYLSYERGRDADTRLDNLWFGGVASLNERALTTAMTMMRMAA